jgi:anti-sigma regulatory factor (Ser/Thr protein kinase)
MDVITVVVPCIPEFVGVVRAFAEGTFKKFERGYAAKLVTSELVTNAVVHSRSRHGGKIEIRFLIGEGSGRIEVIDDGSDAVPIPAAEADEHRRGLRMVVATYADKWGHDIRDGKSIYWAELHWG